MGRYMDLITLFSGTFSIPEGVNFTKEKGYIIVLNAGGCGDSKEGMAFLLSIGDMHQGPI